MADDTYAMSLVQILDDESRQRDVQVEDPTLKELVRILTKDYLEVVKEQVLLERNPAFTEDGFENVSGDDSEAEENYQPRIVGTNIKPGRIRCDKCNRTMDCIRVRTDIVFYRCDLCAPRNTFDICEECFAKRCWCDESDHYLRKMAFREDRLVTLDTVSWFSQDVRPGVDILVERKQRQSLVPIFRYSARRTKTLHNSPPIFHPTLLTIIYPTDGENFLFGDIQGNCYFDFSIPLTLKEEEQQHVSAVSIDMQLSVCNRFLSVARIVAHNPTPPHGPILLSLQVMTLDLQDLLRKGASRLPQLLPSQQVLALGKWPLTAVSRLPYTMIWTDMHLYVTLSARVLKVFKIARHVHVEKGMSDAASSCLHRTGGFQTLEKMVILPASARTRSVHFWPPRDYGDKKAHAKLVLGSLSGTSPEPPIVVYLKQEDIGDWVDVEDPTVCSKEEAPRIRVDPNLEGFDEEDDCDLIVPLMDFQR
ncbi:hypothetical protein B5807_12091 [Epicoccum nigrum]|uniref:Uncharacterized protein n=1 Tax=Epicoccum nigrum TaxID=105696 RepID=A0A1Y2LH22_EPING|nr:hypothetical protein B5807_12091 [Epicoccum nigrum]